MSQSRPREAEPGGRRRRRRIIAIVVAVLAVPVLALGGYLGWLNHVATTNIQHAELLPGGTAPATALPGQAGGDPVDPSEPGAPGEGGIPAPAAVPTDSVGENYLLIGSDARAGLAGARSDVIMLMHVPVDKHNITLVHFPRDLYVYIPGRGRNKINAAFAFGGAPLLVQTLQDMLGVKIDHVAMIGFEGFKRMTDAVGGVDVNVEEGGTIDGHVFVEGTMHLDGATALAFVRERKDLSQGDISRGRRQQAFLKALILKSISRETLGNPATLASFVDAATSNVVVDQALDIGQMRSELISMSGLRGGDVRFVTAPFTGFGRSPYGASIVLVDWTKLAELGAAIREDRLDGYA